MIVSARTSHLKLISNIDLRSFASVLIVLMATVLLSAMSVGVPYHSTLPRISRPSMVLGASRPDAIHISIYHNGEIWLGKERVTGPVIPARIKERTAESKRVNRVYIEADARAKYQLVSEVLAAVRDAGIQDVTFIVSPWSGLPR